MAEEIKNEEKKEEGVKYYTNPGRGFMWVKGSFGKYKGKYFWMNAAQLQSYKKEMREYHIQHTVGINARLV